MPLVVNENGNLLFFASAGAAERYLEPVDVRSGEYVAYDAEGWTLDLSVEQERVPLLFGIASTTRERVRVNPRAEAAARRDELRTAIVGFLRAAGQLPLGAESLPLKDLVALGAEISGTM